VSISKPVDTLANDATHKLDETKQSNAVKNVTKTSATKESEVRNSSDAAEKSAADQAVGKKGARKRSGKNERKESKEDKPVKIEKGSNGRITTFFVPNAAACKPKVNPADAYRNIVHRTREVADGVDTLCRGTLVERTRCLECEHVVGRPEHFEDISLPVERAPKCVAASSDNEGGESSAGSSLGLFMAVLNYFSRFGDKKI